MTTEVLLQQFAREPIPGRVKTRMLSELSQQQACELHRQLVRWTCRSLVASNLGPVELSVTGNTADPLFLECQALGAAVITLQEGCDLGERMHNALQSGLRRHAAVILVGSDCPSIDTDYLQQACAALQRVPLVLGPAQDGGYVLIGARRIEPGVFAGVDWGSAQVMQQTVANLQRIGLAWESLKRLPDVDRPNDLAAWKVLRDARRPESPRS